MMDLPPYPFKMSSLLLLRRYGCLLGLSLTSGRWPLFKGGCLNVLIVSVLPLRDMHVVFMVHTPGVVNMVSLRFVLWLGRAPTVSTWSMLRLG